MDIDLANVAILVGSGLVAGFVNAAAGGGSLLTIPALVLTGLPWDVANASNRVGVLAQSAVTALAFRRAGRLDVGDAAALSAPTILGAALGAALAIWVDPALLEPLIVALLIGLGLLMALRPRLIVARPDAAPLKLAERRGAWPLLFLVGVYGGFLQAGVGYFLIAILGGALRRDLVGANALKAVLIAGFTTLSLAIFVANGLVDWASGLILAVSASLGGVLSVRFQLRVSQEVLRWIVVAMVVATCVAVLLR